MIQKHVIPQGDSWEVSVVISNCFDCSLRKLKNSHITGNTNVIYVESIQNTDSAPLEAIGPSLCYTLQLVEKTLPNNDNGQKQQCHIIQDPAPTKDVKFNLWLSNQNVSSIQPSCMHDPTWHQQ